MPFQKTSFFGFFNKDYTFYTKNLFFYSERCPKFCKNQFFSNIFTFLSVILQYLEYTLKVLANFRIKTQKSTDSANTFSKNYSFGGFFNKDYTFYTNNLFLTTKDALSIANIRFLVTFLSVIHRNYEYNLKIFSNFCVKTKKSKDFAYTFSKN